MAQPRPIGPISTAGAVPVLRRLGGAAAVALLLPVFGSQASADAPPGALAGCGGEAHIGHHQPVRCDTSFTLTGSRQVELVMHPDLQFVGDLVACLYRVGDGSCQHYLRATFVAGQEVGSVDDGKAAGLLEAGTWHMWVAAGSNIQNWQIDRVCPLGPVFDPYCWYGVGGFSTPSPGGSANGRFAGSAVGL